MTRKAIEDPGAPHAEYILDHIFWCKMCKKPRNLNRRRTVVLVGNWKSNNVCEYCVWDYNLGA